MHFTCSWASDSQASANLQLGKKIEKNMRVGQEGGGGEGRGGEGDQIEVPLLLHLYVSLDDLLLKRLVLLAQVPAHGLLVWCCVEQAPYVTHTHTSFHVHVSKNTCVCMHTGRKNDHCMHIRII